ncbi:Acetylcholine receptor subunit alpha-like 1 [Anthophora plagiata]
MPTSTCLLRTYSVSWKDDTPPREFTWGSETLIVIRGKSRSFLRVLPRSSNFYGWTRRTMLRDAWSNDGGKGWWRWWSRLGGLLAMATAISCLVAPFPGASANPEAKRLYDDLLSNYNRLIRPVGNNSDRLTVKMGLRLSQLIDVVSRPHLTHYITA